MPYKDTISEGEEDNQDKDRFYNCVGDQEEIIASINE